MFPGLLPGDLGGPFSETGKSREGGSFVSLELWWADVVRMDKTNTMNSGLIREHVTLLWSVACINMTKEFLGQQKLKQNLIGS